MIRDINSSDKTRIRRAKLFQNSLFDRGYTPLISFHHISELIKHKDMVVGRDSVTFLRSIAAVAWIRSHSDRNIAGAATDVFAAEVAAALTITDATAVQVQAKAAQKIIQFGSGDDVIRPYLGNWQLLLPHLWEQEKRAREIMAISSADFLKESGLRLSDILRGDLKSPAEATRRLKAMHKRLTEDIQKYRDKKLSDSAGTSLKFFSDVGAAAEGLGNGGPDAIVRLLETQGIDPTDIKNIKEPEELGDLATFRSQLKIIADSIGVGWNILKGKIDPNSIPSWIIQKELRKHRDPKLRRDGSELTDRHLACLAAYGDVIYVDKRIHENVLRARRKSRTFLSLVRRIEKISHYTNVIEGIR